MEKIKVLIRCKQSDQNKVILINQDKTQLQLNKEINKSKTFIFDKIYEENDSNYVIYDDHCLQLIDQCLDGFNGTILVYGQSGTGKTYTLNGNESNKGLIQLCLERLFFLKENTSYQKFNVKISCLEIYNEILKDLLQTKNSEKIEIYENVKNEIVLKNLIQYECFSLSDCLHQYHSCLQKRITTSTNLNSCSSRSHFMLNLEIIMENFDSKFNKETKIISKLNFVDLAGSERQKKTNTNGLQLNEACKINNSLTVLGNVISALNLKQNFVPFRNSKLTRILQGSLGNNSKTILISCISTKFSDYVETESTLNFSAKACNIKNRPVMNIIHVESQPKHESNSIKIISNVKKMKHHMVCDFCLRRTDSGKFKLKKPRRPNKKMIEFIKEYNRDYQHINMKLHNNCYYKLAKFTK